MDLCLFTVFNRERKKEIKKRTISYGCLDTERKARIISRPVSIAVERDITQSSVYFLANKLFSIILIFLSRRFLFFFLLFYGWRTITDGTVTIVRMHRRLNLSLGGGGSWNDDTWTRRLNRTWWSAAFNLISVMTRGKRWNHAYFCR
jgi:hypothetical protein